MKKGFIFIICAMMIFLAGCTDNDRENVYVWQADITHDGRDDTIEIDVADITEDNQRPAYMKVYNGGDELIWEDELYIQHAGWRSYYLTELEGEAYLLYYLPELAQGQGIYEYQLFWLNEQGDPQETAANEIIFETYSGEGNVSLPEEKMLAFGEEVNQYLTHSFLLVSTMDGELRYSTPENQITDEEQYEGLLQ